MRRFILTGLLLAGCSAAPVATVAPNRAPAVTDIANPSGTATSSSIGPMGGVLETADGLLRIEVPEGALAADTQVSVTPLANVAPGALRSFRLEPDGASFSKPVTLRFRFSEADLAGSTPAALRIASQDARRR